MEGSRRNSALRPDAAAPADEPITISSKAPPNPGDEGYDEYARKNQAENAHRLNVVAGPPDPLIVKLVKHGRMEAVREFIASGGDVNEVDFTGLTPLQIASYLGRMDMVNALLDAGANVNLPDKWGRTPLEYAAEAKNENVDGIKALLAKGADVKLANDQGQTPLYLAAKKGRVDTVKALLAAGASINQAAKDGKTPWQVATPDVRDIMKAKPRIDTVRPDADSRLSTLPTELRVSIANFAQEAKGSTSPAVLAARAGDIDALNEFHKSGSSLTEPDEYDQTPLQAAIENGDTGTINKLFELVHGLDPDSLRFQRDLAAQIQNMPSPERATSLQRLVYELNQVLLDRNQAEQFAGAMEGRNIDNLVDQFQSNSKGWSLLNLVSGMTELDPDQGTPMLGFDAMRDRAKAVRDQIGKGQSLDEIQASLGSDKLHAFDRLLLNNVARYESARAGRPQGQSPLTQREQDGLGLFYENMLHEPFSRLAQQPARSTAAAAAGSTLKEESPEEVAARGAESMADRRKRFLDALAKKRP